MTQLAMLDEEKEDREIPSAFVPQLRDYGESKGFGVSAPAYDAAQCAILSSNKG